MTNNQDDILASLVNLIHREQESKKNKNIKIKKKESLSEEIRFRIEPSLHKAISKMAKKNDVNLSELCRQIIIAKVT